MARRLLTLKQRAALRRQQQQLRLANCQEFKNRLDIPGCTIDTSTTVSLVVIPAALP